MRAKWMVGATLISVCMTVGAVASEPVCYTTADAAARQSGTRGVQGYRLEGMSRDVFSGVLWATVRSCEAPERPALLVPVPGGAVAWVAPSLSLAAFGRVRLAQDKELAVRAGAKVQVRQLSENIRLEMAAIALGSAAVGDSVRVRLIPAGGGDGNQAGASWGGGERFATGVVTARNVVEVREQDAIGTVEAR